MRNVGDIIGAFLIGVAVGTVVGILYAPQSGEETRKFLSEKSSQALEDINSKINYLKEELEKLKKEASKITGEIVEKISEKFEKKQQSE